MKRVLIMMIMCVLASSTFAQEDASRANNSFMFFLHGGYGILPNKTSGLTNSSADYINDFSFGPIWNLQAYYRKKMFITGLFYSGYTAKGDLPNSSDKILTSYIAPQIGINIPIGNEKLDIIFNCGFGRMGYRNNGFVYGHERKVRGSTLGANLSFKTAYNITEKLGASFDLSYISASLGSTNVNYHDETVKVRYADLLLLHQLTFSIGLKFTL